VESGTIVLWSGAILNIPATWALCDGTNGTPDLRNRFIVGSGATYVVGDTGGAINHDHSVPMTIHTHNHFGSGNAGTGSGYGISTSPPSGDEHSLITDGRPPYYSLAYIMKL